MLINFVCYLMDRMFIKRWKAVMFICILYSMDATGSYVGINIGTDMSNAPPTSSIVSILQAQQIKHVRIFDSNPQLLYALASTGIEVMVGVPNGNLLRIGQSKSEAARWINKNVASFVPATNITYIAVGDDVLNSVPNAALVLVPAMQFLRSALLAANLNSQVKVSSPHSMGVMPKSFPPSTAEFNSTWSSVMVRYLQFLKNTGSPFMLNVQPYYGYTRAGGIFTLDYALFHTLSPDKQVVDPNTLLTYTNMFDAMVDAACYAMEALNFSDIPVLVTATGWPWLGGASESDANTDDALAYNSNLIRHVLNDSGTPSRPAMTVSAYISELFDEDLKPGSVSDKNWGIFLPNGTAVYSLAFGGASGLGAANSSSLAGVFCVASPGASPAALKRGLDWCCGPGMADCGAIQPGQPCFVANNIQAVASYAYNDYYHRTQSSGGTCSFGGTAMISTLDPSFGSCVFAGSSGSNTSEGLLPPPGSAFATISSGSAVEVLELAYLAMAVLNLLVI